jgi:hypothetical protein
LAANEALRGLTSLVAIEDVILYLQQSSVVAPAETENADELLARANLKRAEKGLPPFTLFPASPGRTAQQGKARQTRLKTSLHPAPLLHPDLPMRAKEQSWRGKSSLYG